jgi:hypothetical protein
VAGTTLWGTTELSYTRSRKEARAIVVRELGTADQVFVDNSDLFCRPSEEIPRMRRIKGLIFVAGAIIGSCASCCADEVSIAQIHQVVTGVTQSASAAIGTPISPSLVSSAANGLRDSASGRHGNFAYTLQQGSNNLSTISQVGKGENARVFQMGNRNTALVIQSSH